MKFKISSIAAALLCCMSCVENNSELGGSLIPVEQTYKIFPVKRNIPSSALSMQMADSLSGYSQTRITVGAVRDGEYGLTTRSSALSLVPMADTLDFGNLSALKVQRMHFAAKLDTLSYPRKDQRKILQTIRVYPLAKAIDHAKQYDCNGTSLEIDRSKSIARTSPVANGSDSLSFDFTEEYARIFTEITQEELEDIDKLFERIPGIYFESELPVEDGGRINMYELQLGYDSSSMYVTGNYASLNVLADYDEDGVAETDTTFFFGFGFNDYLDVDSLLTNGSRGSYPEYALNLTSQETRSLAGQPGEKILIEGGGGLKPVISALELKHLAESMISEVGGDPKKAVINKASLIFPFEMPANYEDMEFYPSILSPSCRMRSTSDDNDKMVVFASLTDASSSSENQGDINRSTLQYEPDITYHIQELLKINESPVEGESETSINKREMLLSGQYDIWFIIMANEIDNSSSSSSSSSDLSDYYQYLAYQNYYNSMYGGYGYGSYGYSGYGYDSYSNYYSYMAMAMYASSSSSSSVSYTTKLDKDRFYKSSLCGPENKDRVPEFRLTFSIMNK